MNLGDIYLKTFAVIVVTSFVIAFIVVSLLRIWKCSWRTIGICTLLMWPILGLKLLNEYHQPLFIGWHRWQNTALPKSGCITYHPDFSRLYATYQMSREEFQTWVDTHPWRLHAGDNSLLHHDSTQLGVDNPELSFETQMAPNGQQLRVYFRQGIMYAAYNSM